MIVFTGNVSDSWAGFLAGGLMMVIPTIIKQRFGADEVTGCKPYHMARMGIVRSFQKTNILKSLTVFGNVLTGQYLAARQPLWRTFLPGRATRDAERAARAAAREVITTMGLAHRIDTPAAALSCGELRLLEVALALSARPKVLMLDEPAAGLNSEEARVFGEILRTLPGRTIATTAPADPFALDPLF